MSIVNTTDGKKAVQCDRCFIVSLDLSVEERWKKNREAKQWQSGHLCPDCFHDDE